MSIALDHKYTFTVTINLPDELPINEINDVEYYEITANELMRKIRDRYPNATSVMITVAF